jgi:hypothetical protein
LPRRDAGCDVRIDFVLKPPMTRSGNRDSLREFSGFFQAPNLAFADGDSLTGETFVANQFLCGGTVLDSSSKVQREQWLDG